MSFIKRKDIKIYNIIHSCQTIEQLDCCVKIAKLNPELGLWIMNNVYKVAKKIHNFEKSKKEGNNV